MRGVVLKRTIGTAETRLAPVLVECGRYAGDEDAQREERDEDHWSGDDSNIVSGAQRRASILFTCLTGGSILGRRTDRGPCVG
jgi:hypothetical protein